MTPPDYTTLDTAFAFFGGGALFGAAVLCAYHLGIDAADRMARRQADALKPREVRVVIVTDDREAA